MIFRTTDPYHFFLRFSSAKDSSTWKSVLFFDTKWNFVQ